MIYHNDNGWRDECALCLSRRRSRKRPAIPCGDVDRLDGIPLGNVRRERRRQSRHRAFGRLGNAFRLERNIATVSDRRILRQLHDVLHLFEGIPRPCGGGTLECIRGIRHQHGANQYLTQYVIRRTDSCRPRLLRRTTRWMSCAKGAGTNELAYRRFA